MPNLLLINATCSETRVALVMDGKIRELSIERQLDRGIVGNIYKGRVVRVLPGMQAAFVDIGLDKAAFLYVTDVLGDAGDFDRLANVPESATPEELATREQLLQAARGQRIEELVSEGGEVIVQTVKDPLGTKGARVSTYISLPGRHLVFMPTTDHVGVSRRIDDEDERQRLRELIDGHRPPGAGFIARTVAAGRSDRDILDDIDVLGARWREVLERTQSERAPALLTEELDAPLRAVRDHFTRDINRLIVDNPEVHQRVERYVKRFLPNLHHRLERHDEDEPLFDAFGVEMEIARALSRKVWLPSGGSLVIDQAEALTAIDVNTGRYVGKKNLDETILKTNLEAAAEIGYQLRLRNLGGIIIVDFIDMEPKEHRDQVLAGLAAALQGDRARVNVVGLSELGLVEMTRQRVRESLGRILTEPCPTCEGRGVLKSRVTVAFEILREIAREAPHQSKPTLVVYAHPGVARVLNEAERPSVDGLSERVEKKIDVRSRAGYHQEQFDLRPEDPT